MEKKIKNKNETRQLIYVLISGEILQHLKCAIYNWF